MKPTTERIQTYSLCAYCGHECAENSVKQNNQAYCCFGCATLDHILHFDGSLEDVPVHYRQYDLPEVFQKAVEFESEEFYRVRLCAPAIHCSSCVELIEELPAIDDRIIVTRVNFEDKYVEATVKRTMLLSEVAFLLDRLGYPPHFDLGITDQRKLKSAQKSLLKKLAVIGFCFGNSMLFSIPHYLGLDLTSDIFFANLFKSLNLALSIVVLVYGARDYITSAFKALTLKKSHINIPIALGIIAIWMWSVYEVVSGTGFGYFDSMAGLIFFLLAGKWYQSRVYRKVSFERSIHDLLPMMVRVEEVSGTVWRGIADLSPGDLVRVKNQEVIPVTGILTQGQALIDYSFVTGESAPVSRLMGDTVYIGGKQTLGDITLKLESKPDVSSIWSAWQTPKRESNDKHWTAQVSRFFTPAVVLIAIVSGIFWLFYDPSKSLFVFSSVLIVACPCALALSSPFTYGSVQRYFSKNGLYMKSTDAIAKFPVLTHVVFDKTGTLTKTEDAKTEVVFNDLNHEAMLSVGALASAGNHVIGHWLSKAIQGPDQVVTDFKIWPNQGVSAVVNNYRIRIGSGAYLNQTNSPRKTHVYVEVDDVIKACFTFGNIYKNDLSSTLTALGKMFKLSVVSGDNDSEKETLCKLYKGFDTIRFNNRPEDKQAFLAELQKHGQSAIMIGDGLNDQTALSTSDIGLVITDNINGFYPKSDGVLLSEHFNKLPKLLALGAYAKWVLWTSLAFSIAYNGIGISFAVTGQLNPMIAALLMPISSITVVGLVTALVSHKAKKMNLA